jgi:hypothetical protein
LKVASLGYFSKACVACAHESLRALVRGREAHLGD